MRATIPAAQSHLELPSETLFHGALDMSHHGICIHCKTATLSLRACLLGRVAYHMSTHVKNDLYFELTPVGRVAFHMSTHVKSLSRHNISSALSDRNSGSTQTGLAALPRKNIHAFYNYIHTTPWELCKYNFNNLNPKGKICRGALLGHVSIPFFSFLYNIFAVTKPRFLLAIQAFFRLKIEF